MSLSDGQIVSFSFISIVSNEKIYFESTELLDGDYDLKGVPVVRNYFPYSLGKVC